MSIEQGRARELIREEKELVAALRSLAGLERTEAGLDFTEERRKEELTERLRIIRASADEIASEIRQERRDRLERERVESARRAEEEQDASHKAHLGHFVREEINRYRREEFSRMGLVPYLESGRVELPIEVIVARANAVEDLLGGTRFTADDFNRRLWYEQNGMEALTRLTHDEAAERYCDVPARHLRDRGVDNALGIKLGKDGKLEAGITPEAQVVSPTPGTPHQEAGELPGPIPPSIEYGLRR